MTQPSSHIELGNPGNMRRYLLRRASQYAAANANPYVAKQDTGGQYAQLEGFEHWTVEDWRMGIGNTKPADGPLYSHADTRFPNQLNLPLCPEYLNRSDTTTSGINYSSEPLVLDADYDGWGSIVRNQAQAAPRVCWVRMNAPAGATVRVEITDHQTDPNLATVYASGSLQVTKTRPGAEWLPVGMNDTDVLPATDLMVKVYLDDPADGPVELPAVVPKDTTTGIFKRRTAGTWTTHGYGPQVVLGFSTDEKELMLESWGTNESVGNRLLLEGGGALLYIQRTSLTDFVKHAGLLYAASGTEVVRWSPGIQDWSPAYFLTGTIYQMLLAGHQLFCALGDAGMCYIDLETSTETYDVAAKADVLARIGGYIWRAFGNEIWYTVDGGTWSGPYTVGLPDEAVRGMAGQDGVIYCSTDRGLYSVGQGDPPLILPIKEWPQTSVLNGRGMINWMGSLYIPLGEDVIQMTEAGTLQSIGPGIQEQMPWYVTGEISAVYGTNYYLLVAYAPRDDRGTASVWAYNNEGWHQIVQLLPGTVITDMMLDRSTNDLWLGTNYQMSVRVRYPTSTRNPVKAASDNRYDREGWIYYGWFYGDSVRLFKDWHAFYIDGEYLLPDQWVELYWRSAEGEDWQKLGRFDADHTEYEWPIDQRPDVHRIQLGLLLHTDSLANTPVVRAHVTTYHRNVADRQRWDMVLGIYGEREMLDYTVDWDNDVADQLAHLDQLNRQTQPCLFRDIDGRQYTVKVVNFRRTPSHYEVVKNDDGARVLYDYELGIEQIGTEEWQEAAPLSFASTATTLRVLAANGDGEKKPRGSQRWVEISPSQIGTISYRN